MPRFYADLRHLLGLNIMFQLANAHGNSVSHEHSHSCREGKFFWRSAFMSKLALMGTLTLLGIVLLVSAATFVKPALLVVSVTLVDIKIMAS